MLDWVPDYRIRVPSPRILGHLGPRIRAKFQDPWNQEKLGSRNVRNLEN